MRESLCWDHATQHAIHMVNAIVYILSLDMHAGNHFGRAVNVKNSIKTELSNVFGHMSEYCLDCSATMTN